MNKKLSVVLATRNEENNIIDCLSSVKEIADEIIVVDEYSSDNTRKISKAFGAKVILEPHHDIFHITKQKALNLAKGDWILQLDADERVGRELAIEINNVVHMNEEELANYQVKVLKNKLFIRHKKLIEERDGTIGKLEGDYAGFFVPRRNYFLGKYLRYGGTYPDGVIRLVKRGFAKFPCKSVHEQIEIDGKVGWLQNVLYHKDSPTFKRYLERNSRYIDLIKNEMMKEKLKKSIINFLNYVLVKPISWFLLTTIRHKGILDGLIEC